MDGGDESKKKKIKNGCRFLADVLVPCECMCECVSVFVHDLPQSRCSHVFDGDNESFPLLIIAVIGCHSCCTPVRLPVPLSVLLFFL